MKVCLKEQPDIEWKPRDRAVTKPKKIVTGVKWLTVSNTTEIVEDEAKEVEVKKGTRSDNMVVTGDFGKASLSTMLETEAKLQGIENCATGLY